MDLLAYWRWEAYEEDTNYGRLFHYHFNSNKPTLHTGLEPGANLWLVGGRRGLRGVEYVLLAKLVAQNFKMNPVGYEYGAYRVEGNPSSSQYFDGDGPNVAGILKQLEFSPRKPLSVAADKDIAMAIRSMRRLTTRDSNLLADWSSRLRQTNR